MCVYDSVQIHDHRLHFCLVAILKRITHYKFGHICVSHDQKALQR